jgi:hypothetical protein
MGPPWCVAVNPLIISFSLLEPVLLKVSMYLVAYKSSCNQIVTSEQVLSSCSLLSLNIRHLFVIYFYLIVGSLHLEMSATEQHADLKFCVQL